MQYIITFFAVIAGFLIALFLKPQKKKNIKLLLAFSGAFLLSLTVLHLLPELFQEGHHHHHEGEHEHRLPVGLFIMIGILFQIVLEFFSKGAEHGHVHIHTDKNDELHHIPWLLFVSLCLHALLEGFPIQENTNLAYGIAVHHFPIAIILTLFFVNAKMEKKMIFGFMFAFALMTPLGTFLAEQMHFAQHYSKEISAVVVGILFHISSTIIFESNEGHKFNLAKITMIVLGFLLAFFMEMGHSH
ncbi:ZIP family metal transporter [Flavobacterium tibetense]|mgnify:FL=1|jgi:zinc transporter ZupT|uniref:ZIP family metal transporter n=1 Tax=Flavobacterium tibetense TaxID=2233533 RepID=A0A365P2Y3_9FLAO|nr:ZIP family metal transporter [Flavobacterium tibetense]RBA28876.1 ZIP family metal transporter [Flavobacterium tibetense]